MTKEGTCAPESLTARRDWPHTLAAMCQILAGEVARGDSSILMLEPLSDKFLQHLPSPQSPMERLLLRGQLLEVALKWGTTIHQHFHHRGSAACSFSPLESVLECWHDRSADPRDSFRRWSFRFAEDFERSHIPVMAARARRFLQAHYAGASDRVGLARRLQCTPARVTREFRRAFDMSPAAYQRRLRLWEATRLLTQTNLKVEAVAYAVGYRSKKNFYRATRVLTGVTPKVVRKGR